MGVGEGACLTPLRRCSVPCRSREDQDREEGLEVRPGAAAWAPHTVQRSPLQPSPPPPLPQGHHREVLPATDPGLRHQQAHLRGGGDHPVQAPAQQDCRLHHREPLQQPVGREGGSVAWRRRRRWRQRRCRQSHSRCCLASVWLRTVGALCAVSYAALECRRRRIAVRLTALFVPCLPAALDEAHPAWPRARHLAQAAGASGRCSARLPACLPPPPPLQ